MTDKEFTSQLVKDFYPNEYARIHGLQTVEAVREENAANKKARLQSFFTRKRRLCRKCRTLVTPANTAGGRFKRWHVDCAPTEKKIDWVLTQGRDYVPGSQGEPVEQTDAELKAMGLVKIDGKVQDDPEFKEVVEPSEEGGAHD